MKTPTKHQITRDIGYGGVERLHYEYVWIVDEDDAWEVWCVDCGYRLGTTTNPDIEGREGDAMDVMEQHKRTMHL